ncbi:MAG: hypothetical protein RLZZ384_1425 [Pseudomonadota bacterium]
MIPHFSLDTHHIKSQLTSDCLALISVLDVFDSIDSTNRYLMTQAQNNAPSGAVCFTDSQTAGKGRQGRQWVSPQGANIYGSFLWQFSSVVQLNGLSLAIGVGVVRVLQKYGIDNVGLKWPNDIYSEGKKLGGILIEVTSRVDGKATAVIGLGLNVDLPPNIDSITQAYTDLKTIAPHITLERNTLIAQLLNELIPLTASFGTLGLAAYVNEWRRYDCLQGKVATLYVGKQAIEGMILGIDDNGLLKLQQSNGEKNVFASGEVSFSQ